MKKVMIITSKYTGHGHMSITAALEEKFSRMDIETAVIDGFTMAGPYGVKVSKMYGPITRYTKELWDIFYLFAEKKNSSVINFAADLVEDSFLQLYNVTKPDIIVSVHPAFVGCILKLLEKHCIDIPFVTIIADIVTIAPLWVNKQSNLTVCPSQESWLYCKFKGLEEQQLMKCGFPVRERFLNNPPKNVVPKKTVNFLLMSGGEGVGNMRRIAGNLLYNFDCNVTVMTGKNANLKRRLEENLGEEFGQRLRVLGFVENVQDYMLESDIIFLRGSPNSMFEAVNCNVPIIVTGALPGQEEGNPEYAEKNNLGVVCEHPRKIIKVVSDLLANDWERLKNISESQREFIKSDAAEDIANTILNLMKDRTDDNS
ncbi:MAG: glycosyltransferase [Clostridiales bacterium]|nr:glycosyltransferase [Clostridiales bacterium]